MFHEVQNPAYGLLRLLGTGEPPVANCNSFIWRAKSYLGSTGPFHLLSHARGWRAKSCPGLTSFCCLPPPLLRGGLEFCYMALDFFSQGVRECHAVHSIDEQHHYCQQGKRQDVMRSRFSWFSFRVDGLHVFLLE